MFYGRKGTRPGIKGRPWRRRKQHPDPWPHLQYRYVKEHSFKLSFSVYEDANMDLDINLKNAALGVSPSVVSVVTYSGEKRVFCGSGTIIQCDEANGTYHGTILSSATLVRGRTLENCIADNIKVDVHLFNGKLYKGEILTCDIHYNILLMKILSDVPLTTASIKRLDDCVKIGPNEVLPGNESFQLHPHSTLFKVLPSKTVIAVARYFQPYKLMAAAGFFSVECCQFDCKELFRANCRISKCGIGGPVVNHYGEVIGMSFYADYYTPFLPINVVLKWLEHYKKYLGLCRPQLGMQLANLYTADVKILEKIIQKFPDISAGVIVEKWIIGETLDGGTLNFSNEQQQWENIEEGSPVDTAGLCCKDVIVQCSGNIVQSLLQLFEICWEKAGEVVELVVMRPDEGARLSLSVVMAENRTEKLNRWPLPGMCRRQKWRCY